ncbi:Rho-associated protein kinase 2 [Phlyctochytrium bullatum]|nr:Rho-associated protein kinase 2 [Phlyctochytrium bullatum]
MNSRESPMTEKEARFYVAELILALEELHNLSFIHRDVKPENCLIGSKGHLKLADFGSCIRIGDSNKITSHETVGTPGHVSYGREVDMWSVGIILYELLFDEVPFYSESLMETYGKIMDHEVTYSLYGNNEDKPPFVPELSGPDDTRYFDDEENEAKKVARRPLPKIKEYSGQNLPFIGYTYVHNAIPSASYPFQTNPVNEVKEVTLSSESTLYLSSPNLEVATNVKRHEEEIAELHASRAKDAQLREELEGLLNRLERERNRLDSDLRKMKSEFDNVQRDREEFESRWLTTKRKAEAESFANKARIQQLTDERDSITSELTSARSELQHVREAEANRAKKERLKDEEKETLQKAFDALNAKIVDYNLQIESKDIKMEELNRRIDHEVHKREEYERECQQLFQKNDSLEIDNSNLHKSLRAETAKCERLSAINIDLEKLNTMLQLDISSSKRQLEALTDEKLQLERIIKEQRDAKEMSLPAVNELRDQIENLNRLRVKDMDTIANLQKEKARLEIELRNVNDLLETERAMLSQQNLQIREVEERIRLASERIIFLEDSRSKASDLYNSAEKELSEAKGSLISQIQVLKDVELRLKVSERERNTLSLQLEDLKCTLAKEVTCRQELLAYNNEVERQVAEERRKAQEATSELSKAETAIMELRAEVKSLEEGHQNHRDEYMKALREKENALASLKEEQISNLLRLEVELRSKKDASADEEIAQLKKQNTSLIQQLEQIEKRARDAERKAALAESLTKRLEAELREAETHRALESTRSLTLQDRIDDLDATLQTLREQLEDARGIEFDFSGGLRGFLKVPKFGKVKKGWRVRYAIVRDHKVYMFDKDKDFEFQESSLVADLRADLFVVRPVSQNELIHANAKDIDCIFKVQSTRSSKTNANNLSLGAPELTRRILKLKGEIQHEEKMHLAAEKILTVTTDSQRPLVLSQIDVSSKRIAKMKTELQTLLDCLSSRNGTDDGAGDPVPSLEDVSAEVFEEEIQYCKKELEGQLEEEIRKYNNLLKLTGPGCGSNIVPSNTGRAQPKGSIPIQTNIREIEAEIQATEANLHKIRGKLVRI